MTDRPTPAILRDHSLNSEAIKMDRNLSDRRKRSDATGSRHRRWLYSIALLVTAGLTLVPVLLAVHKDGFQLDGDIATQVTNPATHDWDQVYADSQAHNTATSGADAIAFAHEGHRQFTIGGSKDIQDTTAWNWKNGDKQDKDDILDAFAARYGSTVYFGADRFAINGDAQMGFWFFQNEVGPVCPNGSAPSNCTAGTFGPDAHKDGDILVLTDFTQGGAATFVRVYQWCADVNNPDCAGANSNLIFREGSDTISQDCVKTASLPDDDPFCGTVNSAAINNVPWPYTPKSNTGSAGGGAQKIPIGALFEGGIDLTVLGLQNECFASFIAETRASQTPDATLSEFEGGAFQHCETTVTTTPTRNGSAVTSIVLGQSIQDYAKVVGTGSPADVPTGSVKFYICTPSQLDDASATDDPNTCDVGGTLFSTNALVAKAGAVSTSETTSDAYTPLVVGKFCWRGEYVPDATSKFPGGSDASTGECFTVTDVSSVLTTQIWRPNDTGKVHTTGGSNVNGTLTFTLYTGSLNCAAGGTQVYQEAFTLTNEASDTAHTTSNTSVTVGATTDTSWFVEFKATANSGVSDSSHCETTSLTITN